MSNTRKRAAEPAEKAKPEVIGKGRYAIYQTPDGDGVISYRPDGAEADQHQVVPARFWIMFRKILAGEVTELNPAALMKLMMGR